MRDLKSGFTIHNKKLLLCFSIACVCVQWSIITNTFPHITAFALLANPANEQPWMPALNISQKLRKTAESGDNPLLTCHCHTSQITHNLILH